MLYTSNSESFKVVRYPKTDNISLKAWNAGDEYILNYLHGREIPNSVNIYNDKFGFLALNLNKYKPNSVINYKSQEKAIKSNFELNSISNYTLSNILSDRDSKIDLALIKIPKSNDLFYLFLNEIQGIIDNTGEVVCAFMTKNFNKSIIKIAELFFESIEQSLAWKKSRLLILKNPKRQKNVNIIKSIVFDSNKVFNQYLGVFSANHIDYATQFFIPNITRVDNNSRVLDLASGNGILAYAVRQKCSSCELHLIDDSLLAVESSKLNLENNNTYFHCNDNLEKFDNNYFDLVVSNPPFHFEYENNIEISLGLFKSVSDKLKDDGHFQLVANIHLNYKTHLDKLFMIVDVIDQNDKFVVYDCYNKS